MATVVPDTERHVPLEAVVWTFVALSGVFMGLRVWARTSARLFGTDDVHMAACWACFVAQAILATLIGESGGTRHAAYLTLDQMEHQVKLQIVLEMFGIPCTAFGKTAVAFTILRIVSQSSRWYVWPLWTLIVLTTVTSGVDMLLILFRCGNPSNLWDLMGQATGAVSCLNATAVYNYNTFAAAFQAFADFFLALLPTIILWTMQMPRRRKLAVMALLGLSAFTGIAASVKTDLASRALGATADLTWDLYSLSMWAATEILLIVVCGSIPTLMPLWDRFVGPRRWAQNYGSATYAPSKYSAKVNTGTKRSHTMVSTSTGSAGVDLTPTRAEDSVGAARAESVESDWTDVELARLTEARAIISRVRL